MMETKVAPPESAALEEAPSEEATLGLAKYEETTLEASLLKETIDSSVEKEKSPAQNQPFCAEVGRIACAGCPFLKICKSEELDSFVPFAEEPVGEITYEEELKVAAEIISEPKGVFEIKSEIKNETKDAQKHEALDGTINKIIEDVFVATNDIANDDAKDAGLYLIEEPRFNLKPNLPPKIKPTIEKKLDKKTQNKLEKPKDESVNAKISDKNVTENSVRSSVVAVDAKSEKKVDEGQPQKKIEKEKTPDTERESSPRIFPKKSKNNAPTIRSIYKAKKIIVKAPRAEKRLKKEFVRHKDEQEAQAKVSLFDVEVAQKEEFKKPSFRELLFDDNVNIITTKGFTTSSKINKIEGKTAKVDFGLETIRIPVAKIGVIETIEPIIEPINNESFESFEVPKSSELISVEKLELDMFVDELAFYAEREKVTETASEVSCEERGLDDTIEVGAGSKNAEDYNYLDVKPLAQAEEPSIKKSADIIIRCILGAISIGLYNNIYAQRFSLASDSSRK